MRPDGAQDCSIENFIDNCEWDDIFNEYEIDYNLLRKKVSELKKITDWEIKMALSLAGYEGGVAAFKMEALKRWRDNLDKDIELLIKAKTDFSSLKAISESNMTRDDL